MVLLRENVGDHKVLYIRSSGAEEFDAFDELGPMMKNALRNCPIKSSSIGVLDQVRQKNAELEVVNDQRRAAGLPLVRLLDPKDPQLDMYLARGFLMLNAQNLMKDREEHDALLGVKPIEARISTKSIREQRRSLRASRWR